MSRQADKLMCICNQVAFHASAALRQYFRTHLILHVAILKRRYCGHNAVKQVHETSRLPLHALHKQHFEAADSATCKVWASGPKNKNEDFLNGQ